jgi:hypothetical protein
MQISDLDLNLNLRSLSCMKVWRLSIIKSSIHPSEDLKEPVLKTSKFVIQVFYCSIVRNWVYVLCLI